MPILTEDRIALNKRDKISEDPRKYQYEQCREMILAIESTAEQLLEMNYCDGHEYHNLEKLEHDRYRLSMIRRELLLMR